MSRKFAKPSLTIAQQIAYLRAAGMSVADDARAEHWLAHVSYYRLSGHRSPKRAGDVCLDKAPLIAPVKPLARDRGHALRLLP